MLRPTGQTPVLDFLTNLGKHYKMDNAKIRVIAKYLNDNGTLTVSQLKDSPRALVEEASRPIVGFYAVIAAFTVPENEDPHEFPEPARPGHGPATAVWVAVSPWRFEHANQMLKRVATGSNYINLLGRIADFWAIKTAADNSAVLVGDFPSLVLCCGCKGVDRIHGAPLGRVKTPLCLHRTGVEHAMTAAAKAFEDAAASHELAPMPLARSAESAVHYPNGPDDAHGVTLTPDQAEMARIIADLRALSAKAFEDAIEAKEKGFIARDEAIQAARDRCSRHKDLVIVNTLHNFLVRPNYEFRRQERLREQQQ
jgi:hypothetical protein